MVRKNVIVKKVILRVKDSQVVSIDAWDFWNLTPEDTVLIMRFDPNEKVLAQAEHYMGLKEGTLSNHDVTFSYDTIIITPKGETRRYRGKK